MEDLEAEHIVKKSSLCSVLLDVEREMGLWTSAWVGLGGSLVASLREAVHLPVLA